MKPTSMSSGEGSYHEWSDGNCQPNGVWAGISVVA